jgi:hypothetical protein
VCVCVCVCNVCVCVCVCVWDVSDVSGEKNAVSSHLRIHRVRLLLKRGQLLALSLLGEKKIGDEVSEHFFQQKTKTMEFEFQTRTLSISSHTQGLPLLRTWQVMH